MIYLMKWQIWLLLFALVIYLLVAKEKTIVIPRFKLIILVIITMSYTYKFFKNLLEMYRRAE